MPTENEKPQTPVVVAPEQTLGVHRSLRQDVWRQFRRHKGAVVGLILLTVIVFSAVLGPIIYPYDPFGIDVPSASQGPSWDHILGTDNLGRDVMARILIGGRISLAVGFAAALFGLVIGTSIGLLAGFFRVWDGPLMRLTDLFLALPILPMLLVVIMLFREPLKEALGPNAGIFILVVGIIGITSWMPTARVVRSDVLGLKEREFVMAARSIGTRNRRINRRCRFSASGSPQTSPRGAGCSSTRRTISRWLRCGFSCQGS